MKAKNPRGAGRKPASDPKDKIVLFVNRSIICGEENKRLDVKTDEYKEMYATFKNYLLEVANSKN